MARVRAGPRALEIPVPRVVPPAAALLVAERLVAIPAAEAELPAVERQAAAPPEVPAVLEGAANNQTNRI